MSDLGALLTVVKMILDLEARVEVLLKGISDEKRREAIRLAIRNRDLDALNKLIVGNP
jgi:hypothetical protein